MSRVAQGKLVLAVGPVEMVKVVEAALETVRLAADAKGVRLQPVLDSHATIIGDADRLQQIVANLLSNAIKFTPKGGRVHVRLRRIESHVEVEVADTGQGIDAVFLPYVFDRFRQANSTFNRRSGGLGLGLAIVRSLVELHGGTVAAASEGLDSRRHVHGAAPDGTDARRRRSGAGGSGARPHRSPHLRMPAGAPRIAGAGRGRRA